MLKENLSFIIALGAKNGDEGNNGCVFQCVAEFCRTCSFNTGTSFLIEEKEEKGEALLFCLLAVGFILFKNVLVMGLSRFSKTIFYCLCIND